MRIIYMGTPDFAVPTLEMLVQASGPGDIGIADDESVAPGRGDRVNVGIDRDIGPLVRAQQFGDDTSHATAADVAGALCRRLVRIGVGAGLPYSEPARATVATPREERVEDLQRRGSG